MANRAVSIWKYVKIGKGWKYCRPVKLKNNKLSQDKVLVGGKPEAHTEGNFYLSFYEGDKKQWQKVGPDISRAITAAEVKRFNLQRKIEGRSLVPEDSSRISIRTAIANFLEEMKHTSHPATLELFTHGLSEFADWSKSQYMDELTRLEFLRFKSWVVESGRTDRTAGNKLGRVNQWYRSVMKLEPGKGLVTHKDSKGVEGLVEVDDGEELTKFFAACSPEQHLLFTTFLQSGCRMSELMYAYWDDIDFAKNMLRVREKPEFDFKTKTHEEREIPLPADLLGRLTEAKKQSKRRLIFPTKEGYPNNKWLPALKRLAHRAGLNCGVCANCVAKNECEHWYLHKFRATYATTLLRKGVDVVTVSKLLGHKDLESTRRYLAAMEKEVLHDAMNAVWSKPTEPKFKIPGVYDEFLEAAA